MSGMAAAVSAARRPSSPVATVSSFDREDWPTYRAYRVETPDGWQACAPVFAPDPLAPPAEATPEARAPLDPAPMRFQAALLLSRPGTGRRAAAAALQECRAPEAAEVDHRGQYLRPAPWRPAFGLLLLDNAMSAPRERTRSGEILVLWPLIAFRFGADGLDHGAPPRPGAPMLIVGGAVVWPIADDAIAVAPSRKDA